MSSNVSSYYEEHIVPYSTVKHHSHTNTCHAYLVRVRQLGGDRYQIALNNVGVLGTVFNFHTLSYTLVPCKL